MSAVAVFALLWYAKYFVLPGLTPEYMNGIVLGGMGALPDALAAGNDPLGARVVRAGIDEAFILRGCHG